jgi:hypothetical protein
MKNNANIHLVTCAAGLQAMNDLARIALKAHTTNASPVDIKLELSELAPDMLMEIEENTRMMIESRKAVKNR